LKLSRKSSISAHLLIPHGLGGLVDVHHHGPLEVRHRAGYCVHAVIVRQRPAVAGDVGELVEEGVAGSSVAASSRGKLSATTMRCWVSTGSRVSMIRVSF
jgi:hypothetical protein